MSEPNQLPIEKTCGDCMKYFGHRYLLGKLDPAATVCIWTTNEFWPAAAGRSVRESREAIQARS